MKPSSIITAVGVFGLTLSGVAHSRDYVIDSYTVDGGGVTVANGGTYEVGGTIGQPDAGTLSGGDYTVLGGFWGVLLPVPGVRRPMPEDCADVPPGNRCNDAGTCLVDSDCREESHCILPPQGEGGNGVCYAPKTRHLSISPHPGQRPNTARRITLADGTVLGWVDVPVWIQPTPQHDGLWLSPITDLPAYDEIDFAETWPQLLQVSDCRIAPGWTYHIQAIEHGKDIAVEINYSEPLALKTNSTWGDTVSTCTQGVCRPANGVPGLDDILAAIKYFDGVPVAPLTWLDIAPSGGHDRPDQNIGLGDILAAIAGFQGGSYPGNGPLGCGDSQTRATETSDGLYPIRTRFGCSDHSGISRTTGPGSGRGEIAS